MTNSTSDEREQRLKQIRQMNQLRRENRSTALNPQTLDDIDYLLSLLDSEAAGAETFVGPCVSCGHNNFDVERNECKQRWMEGRMSVVCGCPCAKHNSLAHAAT